MHPDLQRHIGKFYGKYAAVVTSLKDEEKRGQIQVQVPSIFGMTDLVWARPCFPYGHYMVPHEGAQVWVEFEGGDPRYPLYSGAWYPTGLIPQEAQEDPPANRVIQMPSGHTIELQDKPGEEKVVVRHKDNSFVTLDKDGSVLISNKNGSHLYLNAKDAEATLVEEHGNLVRMTSDGVTIVNKSGAVIEMKGDAVKIIAKDAITLTAKDVNIESSTVNLGSKAGISGERVLLAETFLTAYITHTHPTVLGPSGPPLPIPMPIPPPVPMTPHPMLSAGTKVTK
jgi:phage gp45-like